MIASQQIPCFCHPWAVRGGRRMGWGKGCPCDHSPAEADTNGQTHLCSTKSKVVASSWIKGLFVHCWNQLVIPRSNNFQLKWHLTTDLTECFKRVCLLKTTHCYRVMQELSVSTKMLRHVGCLWIGRLWTIFNFSFYFSFTPVFAVCLILAKKLQEEKKKFLSFTCSFKQNLELM